MSPLDVPTPLFAPPTSSLSHLIFHPIYSLSFNFLGAGIIIFSTLWGIVQPKHGLIQLAKSSPAPTDVHEQGADHGATGGSESG